MTMQRKGSQIWWSLGTKIEIDPEIPASIFGDEYSLPRNNSGSALTSAAKQLARELLADLGFTGKALTKAMKRFRPVTHKDSDGVKKIAIMKPMMVDDSPVFYTVCDVSTEKRVNAPLEFDATKKNEHISQEEYDEVVAKLKSIWKHQTGVYDRDQISRIVTLYVSGKGEDQCRGIPMRPYSNGGIWYISERNEEKLGKVKAFFDILKATNPSEMADLMSVPIFDHVDWNNAIEIGASYDMTKSLEKFIKKFEQKMKNGSMGKKQLERACQEAEGLRNLVQEQREELQANAEKYKDRSKMIFEVLDRQLDDAKEEYSFDLLSEMRRMNGEPEPETVTEPPESFDTETLPEELHNAFDSVQESKPETAPEDDFSWLTE